MRHIQTSIPFRVLSITVVLAVSAGARGDLPAGPELGRADFRYAPPWWQSAICLPDDPDKILVGKEGQVLLEFGQGGVRNFGIVLQPDIDSGHDLGETADDLAARSDCPDFPRSRRSRAA